MSGMTDLTAVSLFAGVGGIDLALERAGVTVVAAVEIDPAARGVLADRFPEATLFTDVTEVTADDLRAAGFVPERGIISAGWPCQGNSVAGRRGGMADPRSGLWRHVVRLLGETHARWFLGENVPGLLSVNDGADIAVVRGDLAQLGYWWAERILDAQHFGVPQRRRRIFFVGCLADARRPVEVLLEPEGGGGNPPQSRTPGQGVAATLTAGVSGAGVSAPGRRQEDDVNLVPMPALTARYGKGTDSDATDAMVIGALTSSREGGWRIGADEAAAGQLVVQPLALRGREDGAQLELGPEGGPYNALRAGDGGSSRQSLVAITGDVTHALTSEGSDASEDGTGRGTPIVSMNWQGGSTQDQVITADQVAPTLAHSNNTNGGHHEPKLIEGTTVRRLTPLECERLQGFPDGWTATSNGKPQADSARYRQMGNAVAVPCVEWIARRIIASEERP